MRCEWKELNALLLVASYKDMLMAFVASLDCRGKSTVFEELPLDVQLAIGYIMSLMMVDVTAGKTDPSEHFRFPKPHMEETLQLFPVRYLGFAGKAGNVGPAYLISTCHMESDEPRLFYSDTDIESDWDAATELAERIKRASSGVVGVRVEQLTCLRAIKTELEGERWCITFAIDCDRRKGVRFDDMLASCVYPYGLLVLPKNQDHEYRLMIGEIKDNDPDNAFMLAWHTYHKRGNKDSNASDDVRPLLEWIAQRQRHPLTLLTETEEE